MTFNLPFSVYLIGLTELRGYGNFIVNWKQLGSREAALLTLECTEVLCYYIKQIDSILPWVCSVIDHRRRQNVVWTSVPFFCSYNILTSSVIYNWTDAWQNGIYLLNIAQRWSIRAKSQFLDETQSNLAINRKENRLIWNGSMDDLEKFLAYNISKMNGDDSILTVNTNAKRTMFKYSMASSLLLKPFKYKENQFVT